MHLNITEGTQINVSNFYVQVYDTDVDGWGMLHNNPEDIWSSFFRVWLMSVTFWLQHICLPANPPPTFAWDKRSHQTGQGWTVGRVCWAERRPLLLWVVPSPVGMRELLPGVKNVIQRLLAQSGSLSLVLDLICMRFLQNQDSPSMMLSILCKTISCKITIVCLHWDQMSCVQLCSADMPTWFPIKWSPFSWGFVFAATCILHILERRTCVTELRCWNIYCAGAVKQTLLWVQVWTGSDLPEQDRVWKELTLPCWCQTDVAYPIEQSVLDFVQLLPFSFAVIDCSCLWELEAEPVRKDHLLQPCLCVCCILQQKSPTVWTTVVKH